MRIRPLPRGFAAQRSPAATTANPGCPATPEARDAGLECGAGELDPGPGSRIDGWAKWSAEQHAERGPRKRRCDRRHFPRTAFPRRGLAHPRCESGVRCPRVLFSRKRADLGGPGSGVPARPGGGGQAQGGELSPPSGQSSPSTVCEWGCEGLRVVRGRGRGRGQRRPGAGTTFPRRGGGRDDLLRASGPGQAYRG